MKNRILNIIWAIDCHSLQFLRENKELFRRVMEQQIRHEMVHGLINSFFGMSSQITLYVKTFKSKEAILTGGQIVALKKSPFWICAEICHSVIDSWDRISHNKWYQFRHCWEDFFHNFQHPLSDYSADFRENVSNYFTRSNIHFKYRFRLFEYEICQRKQPQEGD